MSANNFTHLQKLLDNQKITQEDFAKKISVTRQAVSMWVNGKNNPTIDAISKIKNAYPFVNFDWLLYGEGPMLNEEVPDFVAEPPAGYGKVRLYTQESIAGFEEPTECEEKLAYLNRLIEEKDARIRDLQDFIEHLKRKP